MRNMLDQFYSYLSEKIVDFFNDNPLSSGAKFNIQFETEEEVRELYNTLRQVSTLTADFNYVDSNGVVKYRTYLLNFQGIKLIVAATIDDVQPDFLTRLRNLVGVEQGYEDKAILFIHNTTLDSIMGGTESFSKESMPFHIDSIQQDIKNRMNNSGFSILDKAIIELDLDKKKNDVFRDNNSIFEYKEILAIVNGSSIEKDKYKNFGLFFDDRLSKCEDEKEIKKQLKRNASYYERVDEIHNYGNPETQLEKYFEEKGIEKLKGDNWREVEFKVVEKSVEEKLKTQPLQYVGSNVNWDRPEGSSKAKSRIRNVIVFNEEKRENIELEFNFDDFLKKEYLRTVEGNIYVVTSGKKIKATILPEVEDTSFYKIIYKDEKNIKFEFRIVMLYCNEKYLDPIKTKYSVNCKKKDQYISINTNESKIIFNEFATTEITYNLDNNYEVININSDEKLEIKIADNFAYENDNDLIKFKLKIKDTQIPIGVVGTSEKIPPIDGLKVWKLKNEKKNDFKSIGENKLQYGTKEYFTRDEFRKNLDLEKKIVELEGMYFIETNEGLVVKQLEISQEIRSAYWDILNYYKINNKLPSLTYLNDEVKSLYEKFIKCYIKELNAIKEGSYLTKEEKNLFKIGSIKRELEDREILFTPLHPLNIAYQLHLNNNISDNDYIDEIIKKFTSTYLLPYFIEDDSKLYIPVEQNHSPEWKYYVDEKLPRYKSSRDFVAKLVNEKIEEFTGHFKYLFELTSNAPIRINLINTGDSKEILQGIFKYYIKQLRSNKSEIIPIDIFIYSNKTITNAFEEVAFNDDIESLKEIYKLDLNIDNMSEEDVLSLYREKVHFYSKSIAEGIEYAHITFLEMNNEAKTITSNMDDIPSGIILDGLISGVPSVFLGDSYRTGFGTKYANTESNLMTIAIKLNAVNAASEGEPFSSNQCKAISIPNKSKGVLDEIYNSSHWVTFIDPKVDLNFFKNDPDAKDLLIIHYSDQYTTAGGYDAITVTRKSAPYQKVIEEFLEEKGVEDVREYSPSIINMFNAINGDWLLRLLSSKSYAPKEKISILSAIKIALARFNKDNIIWVPISLEEVLRVSGGAGLKQSEGFFSAKNLGFEKNGATSDDILLVGIESIRDDIYVNYYPIEVKIGINDDEYIKKGIKQAKSTKKIFNETLLPKDGKVTTAQKVYRNFLMQLVITSAEKLNLYDVCNEGNWKMVIDSDLRRKLLNEEYTLKDSYVDSIGEAAVISFKAGKTTVETKLEDDVMIIEMSEGDGINYLTKNIVDIRSEIGKIDIEETKIENVKDINKSVIVETSVKPVSGIKEIVSDIGDLPSIEPKVDEIIEYPENRNMEILFGINEKNGKEVYWCPNDTDKLLHTNTGIIGTMGTGKTQFTKSMITQIYRESKYNVDEKKVGILIFDYKGDYNKSKEDFIKATDANVFELYHLPFNPLSVVKTPNAKPMLPMHIANGLKETLAKAFGLGVKQETLLRDLIMEAYEKRGIIKNKPDTWDKPAPTLKDVYDVYVEREDIKKEDSLYAAFSNLIDFEIFEPDPYETKSLFELIDGVTVIDLSGYDPGIQNLVVAITLDLFYSQMQAYGHSKIDGNLRQLNKMVLVDEADNFLSKNFSSLKKILKEGREFGVGTILSTQLLSHFSTGENEYANYILTWVIHNVADLNNKEVRYIFNTQNKQEEEMLFNKIKSLNKHYSLVKMGDSDKAIYMKDRAFWELIK